MLAVVQYQQRAARGQMVEQPLDQGLVAFFTNTENGSTQRGHALGFRQRCQVDEPHPVVESFEPPLRQAQRQACLAAAADAGHRQQARRRQQPREVGECRLAADEACARVRQVVARALARRGCCRCGRCHVARRR